MHIGIMLQNYTMRGGAVQLAKNLATAAASAEAAGLDNVWVLDHFFQIPVIGPAETDMLESYSVLAFVAAHTKRVRLGTLVTGVTYRHPGLLVKTATTLDVLSGGRAWFGIGAAWFEREHLALGVPFPALGERFERLEETLQIALQMWSPNNGPYHGRHYQLQETLCVPQPLSRPRLPILIGGGGEKKTLRLVAQYADACNVPGDAATVAAKLEVLRGHCMRLGRDYDAIKKTANVPYQRDSGKLLAELASLAAVGVQSAILTNVDPNEEQFFETLATRIVPQAAGFPSRPASAAR
jgi:F420-dependent oxidoreductase-like protein